MQKLPFILITPLILGLLYSCKDNSANMVTTVFPDCSVMREFNQYADSAFLAGDTAKSNPFWFDLDSGWQVSCYPANTDTVYNWPMSVSEIGTCDSTFVRVKAVRHWSKVDSLNDFPFFGKSQWSTISPKVEFEKRFRWFFTYYYFSERYPRIELFSKIPLNKYITNEEAEMYLKGGLNHFAGMNGLEIMEKMQPIDQRLDQWLNHNLFAQFYMAISVHLDDLEGFTIDSAQYLQNMDSVFAMPERDKILEKDGMAVLLDRYYKTTAFTRLYENVKGLDEKLMNGEYTDFLNYYKPKLEYHLVMPGKVITTNCERFPADTLHWTVTAYRFTLGDLKLTAQSRKANLWAFVISGIVIVLALITWRIKRS